MSDWKDRLGVVYSTNPDYNYDEGTPEEPQTLPAPQQQLRVSIEKSGRGGKVVTIVRGFVGSADDLKALAKWLKTHCGVGGSQKEGEVLIQGNLREKVVELLRSKGYTATR